ncbi:serine hydrolase [Flavobacterium sp. SUN046]|uniref:serine hydrolase n=1 Tax=Flavobacterium sp. SUN046 TaxID=3002440 RepID=UPI002DBE37DB|nr:serine hydrolase [Flavobacterium sp. SUN046]MEC4051078.1 serine hydrolase [Flavobacterium sp. SUN046]
MKELFLKKISLTYVLLIAASSSLITYIASNKNKDSETTTSETTASNNYNIKRLNGYNYVKPIMFVDNVSESENLASLKQNIVDVIETYKKGNAITSASVYLKEYVGNEWTSINPDEKYMPGSLLKVPELITFLKMNEENPGLLDKQLLFDHPFDTNKNPVYLSKSIKLGNSYSIRELLRYMIEYSDNNATMLLNNNIDVNTFKKVFTDLGLEAPDWNSSSYPITAKDFSLFMRTLYNASYLSMKDSEFATELLGKSDFKDGILKSIPTGTKIAHKFGEGGDPLEKQLHESAIIYIKDKPYLITIMTKGKDMNKLPQVIRQISEVVYQNMISQTVSSL